MATQVQQRRGTTAEHATFTGAVGEVTVDTDKDTAVVHDGTTAGGRPLMRQDMSNVPAGTVTSTMIADGTIVNADVNASAAIAGTKISPDFGSQALSTTGLISANGKVSFPLGTAALPSLYPGTDTNTGIYSPGADQVAISTNGTGRLFVDSNGRVLAGTPTARIFDSATATATPSFQVETTGADAGVGVTRNSANSSGPTIFLGKSRSAALNGVNAVIADDIVGTLAFEGTDGTGLIESALIRAQIDGTPGTNVMPGRLVFSTTSSTGSTPIERMRIGAAGTTTLTSATSTAPFIANIGASEVARIDSSGRLGLGSSSPDALLTVNGIGAFGAGAVTTPSIAATGDLNTGFWFPAADTIAASTGGSERARIDSSGRLLVGTSTARANFSNGTNTALLQVDGASPSALTRNANDQFASSLILAKTRGTANVIVQDSDQVGSVDFQGNDGTSFIPLARIGAFVDGTPGANDMPGRLVFSTTADGASSPTEAMRINNGQELLVGYTSDNGAYKLQVNSQIFATSATVATSDGRYKENVASLGGCLDLVKALRPVSFTWKPQEDITRTDDEGNEVLVREGHNFPQGTQVGFIAQEVQEVLTDKPWLNSVIKENVRPAVLDNEGSELAPEEQFFGIAEGNLIAVLTNALQEAVAQIETLKDRVAALEAS
jgi:hypothetical protein